MTKTKKSIFALGMVAATLCGCSFGSKEVEFLTPFGNKYQGKLDGIIADMQEELGVQIKTIAQSGYPNAKDYMVGKIASGKYPGIAVGYPDHFAAYHGSKILVPLDDLIDDSVKNDFFADYMPENYLVDKDGSKHLYGLPFNKSTELLGYNGVFVEYCADKYGEESLKTPPTTWAEWGAYDDPDSKVYKYMHEFNDLVLNKRTLYATLSSDGHASNFSTTDATGRVTVLDYSALNIGTEEQPKDEVNYRLFSWDSADNAFITLAKQWGAEYTKLPETEYAKNPLKRKGSVLFANQNNLPKTLGMLKFFKKLHNQKIFATPADLGGAQYSSDPFKAGMCMFVVCSSGGMAHNDGMWKQRFRSAPIPYNVVDGKDMKLVISQGANICLTKKANKDKAIKVMKALTTGKYQTRWAMETGYFPASQSSENDPAYQSFLDGTVTGEEHQVEVYQREGSITNKTYYSDPTKGWTRFVDDAFIGSSEVRTLVGTILPRIFNKIKADDIDVDSAYYAELKDILNDSDFLRNGNLNVDLASEVKK